MEQLIISKWCIYYACPHLVATNHQTELELYEICSWHMRQNGLTTNLQVGGSQLSNCELQVWLSPDKYLLNCLRGKWILSGTKGKAYIATSINALSGFPGVQHSQQQQNTDRQHNPTMSVEFWITKKANSLIIIMSFGTGNLFNISLRFWTSSLLKTPEWLISPLPFILQSNPVSLLI